MAISSSVNFDLCYSNLTGDYQFRNHFLSAGFDSGSVTAFALAKCCYFICTQLAVSDRCFVVSATASATGLGSTTCSEFRYMWCLCDSVITLWLWIQVLSHLRFCAKSAAISSTQLAVRIAGMYLQQLLLQLGQLNYRLRFRCLYDRLQLGATGS